MGVAGKAEDEGTDQKSEEEGQGTTEKERHRTTGTEVEMEDAGPETSTGGKQIEGTMETAGNSMVQQHKRARPETPAGARGEIFSYNPAPKRMSVTRVNVKDELVQILDGIKEAQLGKEKEEARDEARWARLDDWMRGWESRRQIEEEASAIREENLMDVARAALAEASAARRAAESMAEMFSVVNGMKYQRPAALQECLHQPCGGTKQATQVEKMSPSKERKEKTITREKVMGEVMTKDRRKEIGYQSTVVDKQTMKVVEKTKMKTMEEKKGREKKSSGPEKKMLEEKSLGPEKEISLEEKMSDKRKMAELEAIMEVDFMATDETQGGVDLEMIDQLHEVPNAEVQAGEEEADMEKGKGQVEVERTSPQQSKITILKRPATKTPKPTWAAIAGRIAGNSATMMDRSTKSTRAIHTHANQATASDLALRKHVRPDERRIVFVRDSGSALPLVDQTVEITSATNIALHLARAPGHIRIERLQKSKKGTLTAAAAKGATAGMVIKFKETILKAIRKYDPAIVDLRTNEDWSRVKVHGIELGRYGKSPDGLRILRQEIEAENPGVIVPMAVQWIRPWKTINERWQGGEINASSAVVVIQDRQTAMKILTTGLKMAGKRHDCERYERMGADSQCGNCCEWGHIEARCPLAAGGQARCSYCAGSHRTEVHQCTVTDCSAAKGRVCKHIIPKCANCDESHFAHNNVCGNKKMAIALARKARSDSPPMTQLC